MYKEQTDSKISGMEDRTRTSDSTSSPKQGEEVEKLRATIQGLQFIVNDKEQELLKLKLSRDQEVSALEKELQRLTHQVQVKDSFMRASEAQV